MGKENDMLQVNTNTIFRVFFLKRKMKNEINGKRNIYVTSWYRYKS